MNKILTPLGFVRKGRMWNRDVGVFTDVIDLQISKEGDGMTINSGVLHPDIYKRCWAKAAPQFVDESSCTVRARIGQLIDRKDVWWLFSEVNTPDDIAVKVIDHVIPFLDSMHSVEAMERFLEKSQVTKYGYPLPIIILALLKWEHGDKIGSCEILSELRKRTVKSWRDKLSIILESIAG